MLNVSVADTEPPPPASTTEITELPPIARGAAEHAFSLAFAELRRTLHAVESLGMGIAQGLDCAGEGGR
jgi:hypothetical protein